MFGKKHNDTPTSPAPAPKAMTKQQLRTALIRQHGARPAVADRFVQVTEQCGSAYGNAALPGVTVSGDRQAGFRITRDDDR